jgi:hypothetical protein
MSNVDVPEVTQGGVAVWVAGLIVVLAAGAATAHGLYEVAVASRTPAGIAWLYPVITDGLALVAYAATTRLGGSGRRYAWSVVVLAAGLSGLAQATFLAGGVAAASAGLRFGVGAWPAVAAAIAAHLLYLIGTTRQPPEVPEPSNPVQPAACPTVPRRDRPALTTGVQPCRSETASSKSAARPADDLDAASERSPGLRRALSPRDRALTAARLHEQQNGALPTVRELESLAQVSRGTAATALQELKAHRNGLHVINESSIEGPNS